MDFPIPLLCSEPEIATPPLAGTILPGVTRMSLLELGASWVRRGRRRGRREGQEREGSKVYVFMCMKVWGCMLVFTDRVIFSSRERTKLLREPSLWRMSGRQ